MRRSNASASGVVASAAANVAPGALLLSVPERCGGGGPAAVASDARVLSAPAESLAAARARGAARISARRRAQGTGSREEPADTRVRTRGAVH